MSTVRVQYWWPRLEAQVARTLRTCPECDALRGGRQQSQPLELQPLPIKGMFYRWSLDLAGPLPLSRKGNRYVIIMVEHFSKWMELVTIPRKEAKYTAEAFLHRVLTLFGAPAEVLTDQGTEFEGEFQALLEECLVDHRRTSRDHPQADGLAE